MTASSVVVPSTQLTTEHLSRDEGSGKAQGSMSDFCGLRGHYQVLDGQPDSLNWSAATWPARPWMYSPMSRCRPATRCGRTRASPSPRTPPAKPCRPPAPGMSSTTSAASAPAARSARWRISRGDIDRGRMAWAVVSAVDVAGLLRREGPSFRAVEE